MKRILKLTLVAAAILVMGSTSGYAQKFGFLNTGELLPSMPEMETVREQLAAFEQEIIDMYESITVEFNNKFQEYQRNYETMSESIRNSKEKELQALSERRDEFAQSAQNDIQNMQTQLMTPVVERLREAIQNVGLNNGFAGIFDLATGALAYHDQNTLTDVTPLVKAELGIN